MILLMSFAGIAGLIFFCSACAVAILVVVAAIAFYDSNPAVKEAREPNYYRNTFKK